MADDRPTDDGELGRVARRMDLKTWTDLGGAPDTWANAQVGLLDPPEVRDTGRTPWEQVREWVIVSQPGGFGPGELKIRDKWTDTTFDLMSEEQSEIIEAILNQDHEELLDGVVDWLYFALQLLVQLGYEDVLAEAFARVHAANMSKRLADGSFLRRDDGKIVKPPGWTAPTLADLVKDLK